MKSSIRWELLGWYALILTAVIVTFGSLLYHYQARSRIERIDAELQARALTVSGSIEWEAGQRLEFELAQSGYFDQEGEDAPYFIVWTHDGRTLRRSPRAPDIERIPPPGSRTVAARREVVIQGPGETWVLVGRGMQGARRELAAFLWAVAASGTLVLLASLLGGWVLVSQILNPIRRMTQAASRISSSNLTERIDVRKTKSELGELARTLNQAFDRLQAAVERQSRFTADASHELRTPLSVLVSNAEVALRGNRSPSEYRRALAACLRSARRMTGVLEGLLTLARADAAEAEFDMQPVDLSAIVGETIAFLKPLAEERRVSIKLEASDGLLRGDPSRLRDAVANLVSNAIRYNHEGGRVEVRVGPRDGRILLRVTDNGIGIPEDARAHVFERFYRVDEARSRKLGGSGLGLTITRWIIEAHGGSIELESRLGEGTSVWVLLPKGT